MNASAAVLSTIRRLEEESALVVTTTITAAELFYGAAKSQRAPGERILVEDFLKFVKPVDLELPAARLFGDLKAALEQQGQRLPDADLLIAAICLANNATLVTGNRRHFDRIPRLVIEDWIRE